MNQVPRPVNALVLRLPRYQAFSVDATILLRDIISGNIIRRTGQFSRPHADT
jgi:hypothetical protein